MLRGGLGAGLKGMLQNCATLRMCKSCWLRRHARRVRGQPKTSACRRVKVRAEANTHISNYTDADADKNRSGIVHKTTISRVLSHAGSKLKAASTHKCMLPSCGEKDL